MQRIMFDVDKAFCAECSLAIRRFVGHMEGVESVETGNGKIVVNFDASKIDEAKLDGIVRDSLDKLGYRLNS